MCGENLLPLVKDLFARGSPPRVRGKRVRVALSRSSSRITPACAGKTLNRASISPRRADHPRVCGENIGRVRIGYLKGRITPACAGKTCSFNSPLFSQTDHPRVCGENCVFPGSFTYWNGSPPRVRGKRLQLHTSPRGTRITPACAGKTPSLRHFHRLAADHPRVCGENTGVPQIASSSNGSPPRVRGKPEALQTTPGELRITPACAGKTPRSATATSSTADHPRVCGENQRGLTKRFHTRGSPPRVRGKQKKLHTKIFRWGITPACAGKTVSRLC